jgi:hypothetical protein
MATNSVINSNQLLDTSENPSFLGLNLTSTSHALSLNNLTTAQFAAQSPAQGAIAFTNSSETLIFNDGMQNQLAATQTWVTNGFVAPGTYVVSDAYSYSSYGGL